jgi:hypothetical protein
MHGGSKIPDHWIARLFAKMLAIWGDGFTRKWEGVNMDEVKATWAQALGGQNEAALKRGFAALFREKYPPDLPRFIELCSAQPAMYMAHTALTHEHIITDAGKADAEKIRALIRPIAERADVTTSFTGIEWAYRVMREADERKIPYAKLVAASEAIGRWCESHHCTRDALDEHGKWKRTVPAMLVRKEVELPPRVPSPHIYTEGEPVHEPVREPGSDDE